MQVYLFQACPRGHRVESSICGECVASPSLYDWLYLGFMAQASLLLHFFFIEFRDKKQSYVLQFKCEHKIQLFIEALKYLWNLFFFFINKI